MKDKYPSLSSSDHVVVDIETLGVTNNCVILSIGAVSCSLEKGVMEKFYVTCEVDQQVDDGRVIDKGTLKWWEKQSDECKELTMSQITPISDSLHAFNGWLTTQRATYVWGNSPSFDFGIIGDACKQYNVRQSWKYSDERDMRTIRSSDIITKDEWAPMMQEIKERLDFKAHYAADDALYEAEVLLKFIDRLNKMRTCYIASSLTS